MTPTLLIPEETTTHSPAHTSTPITPDQVEAARRLAAEVAAKVKQDLRMGREHQQGRVNWITAIVMGLFHVAAIGALFASPGSKIWPPSPSPTSSPSTSASACLPRLLTHRDYRTPKWVEYFVTACGTMALEGGPIFWVATHRVKIPTTTATRTPRTTALR